MTGLPKGESRGQRHLTVHNRQRDCRISGIRLRRLIRHHLDQQLGLSRYDLGVHLVSASRMAWVNEQHLRHQGSTDVITFDYTDPGRTDLVGELLVCPAVAVEQAREYGTRWEEEILRYIVHGVLHLRGYDDRTPTDRRRMKREENRLLSALLAEHPAWTLRPESGR